MITKARRSPHGRPLSGNRPQITVTGWKRGSIRCTVGHVQTARLSALADASSAITEVADRQSGVISRRQALEVGLDRDAIARRVRSGRWIRLHSRIYLVTSGPPAIPSRIWGALLYAGSGATASHQTAAWLDGFAHEPAVIDVTIPERRRVRPAPGLRIHRAGAIEVRSHPSKLPPRTRVEDTVLDLAERAASLEGVVAVVAWACRERLTTAERIAASATARKKLRHRQEIVAVLADVGSGAHAVLEHLYLNLVERAHGLPVGLRQARVRRGLRSEYRDVCYRGFGVLVELDGPVGHTTDPDRWRDMRRDNADALAGQIVLRFGFADVSRRACAVAAQVLVALRQRGWDGRAYRCGPACELPLD